MQVLNFKVYFFAYVLATGLGAPLALAYRPPAREIKVKQGSFIDSYGQAFSEYNRRINEPGAKLNPDQRRRLYEEVFSEAKYAFEKEKEDVNRRLKNISKTVNREVEKVKNETLGKTQKPEALAKEGEEDVGAKRVPAAVAPVVTPARETTTGEVGKEEAADSVKFGSAKTGEKTATAESTVSFSVKDANAPTAAPKEAGKDAVVDGGAEAVSFSPAKK